jgi:hypothetical protein
MKKTITAIIAALTIATVGCGLTAAQWAGLAVTIGNDTCTFISQDDPTAPTSVKLACKVEGQAGPLVVNLPWSAWQAALTQQKAAALKASKLCNQAGVHTSVTK